MISQPLSAGPHRTANRNQPTDGEAADTTWPPHHTTTGGFSVIGAQFYDCFRFP